MSYDLRVYSGRRFAKAEFEGLLAAGNLAAESEGTDALIVGRGAAGAYTFTLGLPVAIDAEDVPDIVVASVLDPSWMTEILVEGSSPLGARHAVRFARKLARASNGAVHDPQDDTVWSRSGLRTPPRVELGLIDLVDSRWYVRSGLGARVIAEAWLRLSRRHLPEALPQRFGEFEPLQHRLSNVGDDAFTSFAQHVEWLIMKGSRPCLDGRLPGVAHGADVRSIGLSIQRAALLEPTWRAAFQSFFVALASEIDAIYATADVIRGLGWNGRSVWCGLDAESASYLAPRGEWHGLSPYPVWLTWYGTVYAPLVTDDLRSGACRRFGGSLLHIASESPVDRDVLRAIAETNGWVAEDLRARAPRVQRNEHRPVSMADRLPLID